MSPTARTLHALRRSGYTASVVETWVPVANVRRDFLGIIDIIALRPGDPPLGIQATTASNLAARRKKALGIGALRVWLRCGCTFEVWGWFKDHAGRWHPRREALTLHDTAGVQVQALTPKRRRRRAERTLFDSE